MTLTLVRKLLRDLGFALAVVALLLLAFQALWVQITHRILGQLAPFFNTLAEMGGLSAQDVENQVFAGPGRAIRTLIGGERVDLSTAMDVLSVGYVHPLMQTIFCIWAVGRAAGAIAGEIDRGTMELLLAQPLARSRIILAHLCVDLVTIPVLCLSLWAGTCLGAWITGPIQPEVPILPARRPAYLVELGPFKVRLEDPIGLAGRSPRPESVLKMEERLRITPSAFGPGLWVVGGLMFALSGVTLWLSASGRFRWRVLGIAVLLTLVQFLVNLLGQMWEVIEPLRPLTIFYYYQPQQVILGKGWDVTFAVWNHGQPLAHVPMTAVLYGIGVVGYALALRTFCRRDLPAPL
jgi:ABC-2 type transport system permease protein